MKNYYNVVILQDTELIGVVSTLAGSKFLKIRNNRKYVDDIFAYFEDYKNHTAVKYYQMLEEKYSFNYDKPICLVLDEKDEHKCSDTLCGYVGQEAIFEYSKFYDELLSFKKVSNFENFYNSHLNDYSFAIENFNKKTPVDRCIQFLKQTTNETLKKNYIINLMFAITSSNYGWQTSKNCYCNIRPYKTTVIKNFPSFSVDKIYVETLIVHEFGHSIINPITDKHKDIIQKLDNDKFNSCFKHNVYGQDKLTVINENIIRAIECLYVEKFYTKNDFQNFLLSYENEGFIVIGDLISVIKNNSTKRISDYYKLLIDCFA